METSGDTGIVLTEHARRIALDFAVAVGSFMVVFIAVMCRMTNEIFVARRYDPRPSAPAHAPHVHVQRITTLSRSTPSRAARARVPGGGRRRA